MATLSFGATLRKERMLKNIGLNQFAKRLGVAGPYLSDIELDKRVPSRKAIVKIVKTLITADQTQCYEQRRTLFDDLLEKSGRMSVERRALIAVGPTGSGLSDTEIREILWGELKDDE